MWTLPRYKQFRFKAGKGFETEFFIISGIEPWAMTSPPSAPDSGPISIIQSDSDKICVSWSTSITEFPSFIRSCINVLSPVIFDGCSPMEGSSSTYKTPVVRFLTERASCILCLSPVDSVEAALSKDKYPRPSSISLFVFLPMSHKGQIQYMLLLVIMFPHILEKTQVRFFLNYEVCLHVHCFLYAL